MSVNCYFVGRLGKDPEVVFQGENPMTRLSVAVNDGVDKNKQKLTEWVDVEVRGKAADACARFLSKGSQVFVTGVSRTSEFKTKTGENARRQVVHTFNVEFVGGKPQQTEDDLPF